MKEERKSMKKRFLFCVAVLCLLFSGCGKQDTETSAQGAQTTYVANACGVPNLQGTIGSTLKIDSKLYAGVYTRGIAVEDGRYCVVTYDISDGTNSRTILQGKEEMIMWSFTVLEDGNYKALFYTLDTENKCYASLCLLTFDQEGSVIEEQDITQKVAEQVQDFIPQFSFCMDRTGNLYFYISTVTSGATQIYIVGNSGEVQLIKEYSGIVYGIQAVSSQVWAAVDNGSQNISIYDLSGPNTQDSKIADLKLSAKSQTFSVSDGFMDTQKFITLDSIAYEYDLDSQQLVKLFAYEDVELEYGLLNTGKLIATAQDEFYVLKKIEETEEGSRTYDWVKITKSDEVSQKEILTIAVSEENSPLREAVTAFNKSSDQYKVIMQVYETDVGNNPAALLQADIAAGKIPDMAAVDIIDLDVMINKGLVCNLSDLLERDTELSRNDFVGSSLEIYTRGDKLYAIPQSLAIIALTGKQKMLDDRENWNLKEFEEYVHSLPNEKAATLGISKSLMLQVIMEQYLAYFVDWESRSCSFESQEFAELLQFINMYPDDGMDSGNDVAKLVEMFQADEIVLYPNSISSIFDYQIMQSLWGEEITYIGFPASAGTGIQLTDTATAYVITENSAHKEEMWQIIKYMVTKPELARSGLPAYRPLFDKACEDAMEKNMTESPDGLLIEEPKLEIELVDMEIAIFAATDKDINMIKDLFEKAEPVKASSYGIKNIIQEEVWGYFSGQKDVEDVASIIQNRVTIYLNE